MYLEEDLEYELEDIMKFLTIKMRQKLNGEEIEQTIQGLVRDDMDLPYSISLQNNGKFKMSNLRY